MIKQTFQFDNKSLNPLKVRIYQLQISPRAQRPTRFSQKKVPLKRASVAEASVDWTIAHNMNYSVESCKGVEIEVEQPLKYS